MKQSPVADQSGSRGAVGAIARGALFELLSQAGRVTLVAAPAGSGKSVLLRSWIDEAGAQDASCFVSVRRNENSAQGFWAAIVEALRTTAPGAACATVLTPSPSFDGWSAVERLLGEAGAFGQPVRIVIDDVHELRSPEALRQLELLLLRAPDDLHFVLAARHDPSLGLHRLRLEGELTEIRSGDLRFSIDEARELMDTAGAQLSESALALLVERTEGWAAGLRLAALSLVRHPDPDSFAAEFSGSERTVAEYLLAEVLDRQPDDVRRLLLRTSILERVCGSLADALTGDSGGERILQDLEDQNAFVVSLDAGRSWFRQHHLFADLLQFELRRTAPDELPQLHGTAADWYARHGFSIEAVRHAQAAGDWEMAARLLFDHWIKLVYGGQAASAHDRLREFPPEMSSSSPEVAALIASAELTEGSVEEAEARIDRASVQAASVSGDRHQRLQVMLSVLKLSLARRRGDLLAADDQARQLLAPAVASDAGQIGIGDELRALAMIKLGIAEAMSNRVEAAEQHLERGVSLARRIGQPYLEVSGLGHLAIVAGYRSVATETKWSERAIELGLRHGWEQEPEMAPAYIARAFPLIWAMRLDEAEPLLVRARRALRAEADPGTGWMLEVSHGFIEIARGRTEQALVAFREAERLAELLVPVHQLRTSLGSLRVQCLVRLGDVEAAANMLERMDEQERETENGRSAVAVLLLARGQPEQAASLLAPVVGDPPAGLHEIWLAIAMLLEAKAKAALGDIEAAQDAFERLLDMAEREHLVWPFLLHPVPELLERHRGHRTTHAGLVADILDLLSGAATRRTEPQRPYEPLTVSELRVLRYLPTNLSIPEIAGELNLSANTVKTHVRHLYAKLDAHGRSEAVERARELALLADARTARS